MEDENGKSKIAAGITAISIISIDKEKQRQREIDIKNNVFMDPREVKTKAEVVTLNRRGKKGMDLCISGQFEMSPTGLITVFDIQRCVEKELMIVRDRLAEVVIPHAQGLLGEALKCDSIDVRLDWDKFMEVSDHLKAENALEWYLDRVCSAMEEICADEVVSYILGSELEGFYFHLDLSDHTRADSGASATGLMVSGKRKLFRKMEAVQNTIHVRCSLDDWDVRKELLRVLEEEFQIEARRLSMFLSKVLVPKLREALSNLLCHPVDVQVDFRSFTQAHSASALIDSISEADIDGLIASFYKVGEVRMKLEVMKTNLYRVNLAYAAENVYAGNDAAKIRISGKRNVTVYMAEYTSNDFAEDLELALEKAFGLRRKVKIQSILDDVIPNYEGKIGALIEKDFHNCIHLNVESITEQGINDTVALDTLWECAHTFEQYLSAIQLFCQDHSSKILAAALKRLDIELVTFRNRHTRGCSYADGTLHIRGVFEVARIGCVLDKDILACLERSLLRNKADNEKEKKAPVKSRMVKNDGGQPPRQQPQQQPKEQNVPPAKKVNSRLVVPTAS